MFQYAAFSLNCYKCGSAIDVASEPKFCAKCGARTYTESLSNNFPYVPPENHKLYVDTVDKKLHDTNWRDVDRPNSYLVPKLTKEIFFFYSDGLVWRAIPKYNVYAAAWSYVRTVIQPPDPSYPYMPVLLKSVIVFDKGGVYTVSPLLGNNESATIDWTRYNCIKDFKMPWRNEFYVDSQRSYDTRELTAEEKKALDKDKIKKKKSSVDLFKNRPHDNFMDLLDSCSAEEVSKPEASCESLDLPDLSDSSTLHDEINDNPFII